MNFRKVALFATIVALVACAPAWAQDPCVGVPNVVICHTFDQTGNLFSSQNDVGNFGNFATVYDNFTLAPGTLTPITTMEWVGGYFNPPAQGPITGWTITFWNDNAGQPGSQNYKATIVGTGNETFLGNFGGFPVYKYSTAILNAQNLNPGTQYWVSVVPDLTFPPQWGWASASTAFGPCDGCDGLSYQDFFGARSQLGADMAFALDNNGQVGVPEPGTLVMLGTGVLGLAGAVRRKLL
jgi:hypothetical protein